MASDDVAVRLKPPGRPWQRFGADPENVSLSSNTYGPDQASLTLRRDTRIPWGDLVAFTPIEVEIAGVVVWAGRLKDTPGRDWDASLNAEGWQYLLDDTPIRRLYVHNRLSDWKDRRSFLTAPLGAAAYNQAGTISTEGGIQLGWPNGEALLANALVGATLDLGPSIIPAKITFTVETSNNSGTIQFGVVGTNNPNTDTAYLYGPTGLSTIGAGPATVTVTNPSSYRYLTLRVVNTTGTTIGADVWARVSVAIVYGSTAYESGDASILHPDTVIKDALTQGAPNLATDLTQITADTFAIPAFTALDFQTPRELADGVNALRNYILRVGVDRRVTWKPRPTNPLFHVGAWSDYEFEDASLNNGQEIYDQVAVTGTAADSSTSITERSQTVPVLALTGTTRKKIVTVDSPLTTAVGQQIGDTFLDTHKKSSMHGTVTVRGPRSIRGPGGETVHPSLLLRSAQELLRFDDRVDPDTGGVSRDGMLASVTYDHGNREVSVEVDNERRSWDAMLATYNLLAGAATSA